MAKISLAKVYELLSLYTVDYCNTQSAIRRMTRQSFSININNVHVPIFIGLFFCCIRSTCMLQSV